MALSDILKEVMPTVATALGGPLAGAAVSFLAGKLGVSSDDVQKTIESMNPDEMVKLKGMDYDFQKHMADNGIALQLAQVSTNTQEAQSVNWFVAGGRPFILWICGIAFAYAAVFEPIARFVAAVGMHYQGSFPVLDTAITEQVLFGLLGLGGMRTVEKLKNAAGNH